MFQQGSLDMFILRGLPEVGALIHLRIGHDGTGEHPGKPRDLLLLLIRCCCPEAALELVAKTMQEQKVCQWLCVSACSTLSLHGITRAADEQTPACLVSVLNPACCLWCACAVVCSVASLLGSCSEPDHGCEGPVHS